MIRIYALFFFGRKQLDMVIPALIEGIVKVYYFVFKNKKIFNC